MSKRVLFLVFLVLLIGLAVGSASAGPAGLIGWWKFDDGTGTVVKDWSGKGNDGTFGPEGAPKWVAGKFGGGIYLDGADDYININAVADDFPKDNNFTISAWIMQTAADEGNVIGANDTGSGHQFIFGTASNGQLLIESQTVYNYPPRLNDGQWHMITYVRSGTTATLYTDGVQVGTHTATGNPGGQARWSIGQEWDSSPSDEYLGSIDDVRFYSRPLSPAEVQEVMKGESNKAGDPNPADKATDVPRDATLSWTAIPSAGTHDVYFGTTFTDVNTASRADAKSVLAKQGQADATYDPAGVFVYGQTYYWRIDEVNKTPDATIFKGDVWSFTAEPYGYPVKPVKATASSAQPGMGPEKTIDDSGMTGDLAGSEPTTMWLSAGVQPNWIQYEFDKVYKLYQLLVWNSNQMIEPFMGFGAKTVKIETSTDGTTWKELANAPEFARGSGAAGYAANTTVNFGGVEAKFVKLTVSANWGGLAPQTGLAEVRFSYVPVQARAPQPAAATTGVSVEADLNWRPGREAGSHSVSLGTDPNALGAAKKVTDHSFDPGSLNFGTKYYWKVDEVNTVTYPGDVWSFTTQEYRAIDDFESYTDKAGEEVFTAWVDGYATGLNGSTVGNDTAAGGTFGETAIIHGGKQSMPLLFDNSKSPFYSEGTQTFASLQDWTGNGANSLSLWVRGQPAAFIDKGNGAFTVAASGHDIWDAADDFRFVYKKLSGDGSIVVKVDSLLGSTNTWAKAGVMIRQTLEDGSPMVDMVLANPNGANGANFQWRATTGANASSTNSPSTQNIKTPQWVKLTRKGNVFSGQYSSDGTTWLDIKNPALTGTPVTTTVNMMGDVYIGLCLTGHDRAQTAVAEFSGAATTGTVTGAWQQQWIGDDPDLTMDVASVYLIVEDSAGKSATATNATIANAAAWTQWSIPFSDLTGVSLAKVKKLTIGVGDKKNPAADGKGKIYIDDIGYGRPVK